MTKQPLRSEVVMLHLAVAASTTGLGVILALLADLQDSLGISNAGLGLVGSAAFLTSFVGYIWLSRYADRGFAKPMLVIGLLVSAAALVWAAYADGLWTLVGARALLGVAEGVFVPAARRIVLDWSPERPGEVLGRILAAAVAGFALGPVLGGLLAAQYGLRVPFLVPAAIMLLALPAVLRVSAPAIEPGAAAARTSMKTLLTHPAVLAGVSLGALEFAGFGAIEAIWARLLADLGASTVFIGASFTFFAIPLVLLSSRFGRIVDRRSPGYVARIGVVLILPAFVVYGFAGEPILIAGAGIIHAIGAAAVAPAAAAYVASGSPRDMIARGQGMLEAAGFLAAAVVAAPSGWAYETVGRGMWMMLVAGLGVVLLVVAQVFGRRELVEA